MTKYNVLSSFCKGNENHSTSNYIYHGLYETEDYHSVQNKKEKEFASHKHFPVDYHTVLCIRVSTYHISMLRVFYYTI